MLFSLSIELTQETMIILIKLPIRLPGILAWSNWLSVFKHSGSIPRNACVRLRNIAMRDYQESAQRLKPYTLTLVSLAACQI